MEKKNENPIVLEFQDALKNNDIDTIQNILTLDNLPSGIRKSGIKSAVEFHRLKIIELLINNDKINLQYAVYALSVAASKGYIDIVEYLINNDKYMSHYEKDYQDLRELLDLAFSSAAESGNVKIGQLIIDKAEEYNRFGPYKDDFEINMESSFKIAVQHGNLDFVKFLLNDEFADPKKMTVPAAFYGSDGNVQVLMLLLQDVRVDPSAKKNKAVLVAYNKLKCHGQYKERDYVHKIINLLLSDDRTSDERLSPQTVEKKMILLKHKLWSLKRLELQSDENIDNFLGSAQEIQNIWEKRYQVLQTLENLKLLENEDTLAINDPIFIKYYLMTDDQLIKELIDNNIPKYKYLTHTGAALLMGYLKGEKQKFLLKLLFDIVPLYIQNKIKKLYNIDD